MHYYINASISKLHESICSYWNNCTLFPSKQILVTRRVVGYASGEGLHAIEYKTFLTGLFNWGVIDRV